MNFLLCKAKMKLFLIKTDEKKILHQPTPSFFAFPGPTKACIWSNYLSKDGTRIVLNSLLWNETKGKRTVVRNIHQLGRNWVSEKDHTRWKIWEAACGIGFVFEAVHFHGLQYGTQCAFVLYFKSYHLFFFSLYCGQTGIYQADELWGYGALTSQHTGFLGVEAILETTQRSQNHFHTLTLRYLHSCQVLPF